MRFPRSIPALAALALLAAPAAAQEETEPPDHARLEHRFVRITDGGLFPEELHVSADHALGWINYSSKNARVVFDAEVARSMHCTAPGRFRLTNGSLESSEIQAWQFASLCHLDPGTYAYRAELSAGAGQGGRDVPRVHEGTIVVEAGEAGAD